MTLELFVRQLEPQLEVRLLRLRVNHVNVSVCLLNGVNQSLSWISSEVWVTEYDAMKVVSKVVGSFRTLVT